MAYSNPLYDSALSATAQVRLNNVDMEKIESANGIATEGSYYGISFANLKTAGDETANTDGFGIVNDGSMANLYVNIGTIDAPIFVSISDRIAQLNLAQPSLGLDLDNITVRLGGIFADNTKLSNSDNRIYWMPAGSEGGDNVAAFNIFAIDQVNGIWGDAGDHRSATNIQVNIDVAAVNDAPVVDVATDTVSVDEDGALSFSDVFNSVSDVDDDSLTVSLSVSNGELSLLTDAGLTYSDSDGSDGTIAFSGTKAAVNAALESLQYNPDANFNGTDQLQVVVTDGNSNGNGAGQLTDTALIDISVNSVNDAPVNNFSTDSIVIDTRDTDSYTFTDISVSDVDTGSGNITVSLSVNGGSLDLGATDNLSFDDADGSDGTLKFTGSLSDVNAALNGLTYSADTDVGDRTLTITTSDNGNSGAPGVLYDTDSIDITLQANQAPELGADDFNVSDNGITYVAGNSVTGNILSNDSDPESDAFSITQLSGFGGVDSDGSNDFYVNGAYGSLDLNSDGSFSYTVTDDSLAAGEVVTEVFTYTVLDSEGNESSTDISFTVSGANDAPQASDNYASVSDDGETNSDGNSVSGNVISGGVFGEDDTDPDDGDSLHVVGVYGNAGGEDDVQLEGIVTTTDGYGRVTFDLIQGYTSESFTDVDVVSFGNNSDSADTWNYVRDAWQGLGSTVNLDQFIFASANDAFVSPDSASDYDSFYFDTTWHFGGDNVNAFTFAFAVSSELDYDGLSFYHSTDGINYELVFDSVSLFENHFSVYQTNSDVDGTYSVSDIDSLVSYDDNANFAGMGNLDLYFEEKGAGENDDLLSGTYTGLYAAGTHYFRWVYDKDGSVSNGYDAAYVGNIGSVEITSNIGLITVDSDGTLISGDHGYLIMSSDGSYEYVVTDESLDDTDVVSETFTYVVADESGATDSANLNITVYGANDAPDASDTSASLYEDDVSVSGNVLTNTTDVDAGDIVSFDGIIGTNLGEYGFVTFYSDGSYTYTVTDQTLAAGDTYTETFSYAVTDGTESDTATLSITVTGNNDIPVAANDTDTATDDGVAVSGNLLTNDTDIDNSDTLSVLSVGTDVDGSDGFTVYGTYGVLNVNSNGSYSYTVTDESLDTDNTVSDYFYYVTSDEGGLTAPAALTINITGSNDAPDAVSDTATVTDNGVTYSDGFTVSNNVLVNDTDVDIESIRVVSVDGIAVDSDGETIYGDYGYLVMDSDGDYTYTVTDESLAQGEVVTESFSYMISDGNDTDTTTLSITVNGANDRPEAFNDTDTATDDGVAVSGNLLTNDTDIDNSDTLSVLSVGADVDGSDGFTVYGTYGVLNVNSNGGYSYTVTDESLDTSDTVSDYFYYVTSDEGGLTAPAALTINITGSNDAPDASDTYASVYEDDLTVTGNVILNATDVDDGDILSFSGGARTAYGEYGYVNFNSDGSYTYTVTDETLGVGDHFTESFSYAVTDGDASDTATLYITVDGDNDQPDLNLDGEKLNAQPDSDLAFNGFISISDTDVNDQMTVNLTVTNGVLGFVDTDINVTGDLDGSDGELEFTGSITDVNNALAKLKYTATELADDTLVIIANDDSGAVNDTVVGTVDIRVGALDQTFEYAFNSDIGGDYINMDPLSGDYSNIVINGISASELLVADTGTDVELSDPFETLTLGNVDFTILDGSKVSFADGSVLLANTSGAASTLLGSVRNDQLISGNLGDTLRGLDGDDLLIGGAGRDRLLGGDGNDIIIGGNGSDLLTGGSGNDFFVFKTSGVPGIDLAVSSLDNGKTDTIYDFTNGEDRIFLVDGNLLGSKSTEYIFGSQNGLSESDYNSLVTEKNVQGGVQLTFNGGAKILILGSTADDINQDDFMYATGLV